MRYAIALTLLILGLGLPIDAAAQTGDYLEFDVFVRADAGLITSQPILCPEGYIPISIRLLPAAFPSNSVQVTSQPIDANLQTLDVSADAVSIKGYRVLIANGLPVPWQPSGACERCRSSSISGQR